MTQELPAASCLRWHRGVLILRHLSRASALLWCPVCERIR